MLYSGSDAVPYAPRSASCGLAVLHSTYLACVKATSLVAVEAVNVRHDAPTATVRRSNPGMHLVMLQDYAFVAVGVVAARRNLHGELHYVWEDGLSESLQ